MGKKKKKETLEMSINEVDNVTEGILYFLRFILIKHFYKIIVFSILVAFVLIGFKCESKWLKFEKKPLDKKVLKK